MSCSQQIDIENLIFARAARLGVRVDGVRGQLRSLACDPFLQYCLWIYNTFFAQLPEDCGQEAYSAFWHTFDVQSARLGPCGFGGCWGSVLKKLTKL